jgi:TRAP-type C4-dicarboxylate transport system permease small subunit
MAFGRRQKWAGGWVAREGHERARHGRLAAGLVSWSDRLNRVAEAFIIVDLAAMTLLVIADVIARSTVASIVWSEELGVRFLGTWFVFIGASVAFKRGQLVAITFFVTLLRPRLLGAVYGVSGLLIAGFIMLVLYFGMDLVLFTFAQPSPIMGIPMGYAYLGVPIGSGVMLVHALALALEGRAMSGATTVA